MIILTAANTETAKDDLGKTYKNFSFLGVIKKTIQKAEDLGYTPAVYDLGSLGIGRLFSVADESFKNKGYYEKEVIKGYKSKSLFKPAIVKDCIEEYGDFTAYLDGDAQLCDSIDEIEDDDYDVGVTLRTREEINSDWHQEHFEIVKYVNAGVIFFNPTQATKKFLDIWHNKTEEVGNDQKALNQLTCQDFYPEEYSIHKIDGVRIKYFPGEYYNYYYFNERLISGIKIMHFKGDVRHFYPFDWKKRLYCRFVLPNLKNVKSGIKKLYPFTG